MENSFPIYGAIFGITPWNSSPKVSLENSLPYPCMDKKLTSPFTTKPRYGTKFRSDTFRLVPTLEQALIDELEGKIDKRPLT